MSLYLPPFYSHKGFDSVSLGRRTQRGSDSERASLNCSLVKVILPVSCVKTSCKIATVHILYVTKAENVWGHDGIYRCVWAIELFRSDHANKGSYVVGKISRLLSQTAVKSVDTKGNYYLISIKYSNLYFHRQMIRKVKIHELIMCVE